MKQLWLALALLAGTFLCGLAPALAHDADRGATYLLQNVTIGPGETVNGDLTVLYGNATVFGTVHGDVNVIGGSVVLMPGSEIDGQVNQRLGNGWLREFSPWVSPWFAGSNVALPFAEQNHRLLVKLAGSIIVLFVFLLFPVRVRIALERVERHPGFSALAGMVALVAVLPIALLLLLSIVGIPLIALEIAAIFAGVWIGHGAIALLVGRRLYELVIPRATPSPLGALVLGLVVVSAAEIVPVVGWLVTILVWVVGLGAAVLAFIRDSTFRGFAAFGSRPPIGGSPMNPA